MITYNWKKSRNYEKGKCGICGIRYEKLALTCDEKGICNSCEQAMYELYGRREQEEGESPYAKALALRTFRDRHKEEILEIVNKARKCR